LAYKGVGFGLLDEFVDEYEGLIRFLLAQGTWGEKFSEKYMELALRKLIVAVLGEAAEGGDLNRAASKQVEALVAELDAYSEEHICYVPVVGLSVAKEAAFGRVVLKTLSSSDVEEIGDAVESVIMSTQHTEEEKPQLAEMQRAIIGNHLEGVVCAEFRVIAEPNRARERAEDETRRVLELLRFARPALYPENLQVAVGLAGEVFRASRITPTYSPRSYNLNVENTGPHFSFDLSEETLATMRGFGVFEVSEVLRKNVRDLTQFEETLLRGIHWFSVAEVQQEAENKLLSLVTCLETFLAPRDGSPIRTAISEGVAMIVSEGLENRRQIKRKVMELYKQRSGVSHGGRKAVLESDLQQLKVIARTLITKLIKRKDEFSTQKELLDWLEEQRLS
jgi:hypothetical protein